MIREILHAISQMFAWFVVVTPWEQALRVRLGKRVRLLRPGFYLRIPFVDRVYRQSVRRRLAVLRPQTISTSDGVAITLSGALGYEVTDLRRLYESLHDAEETIETEVLSHLSEYVMSRSMAECSARGAQDYVRERLELKKYGLGEQEFFLANFAAVRTLRIITGDMAAWSRSEGISTTRHDGEAPK